MKKNLCFLFLCWVLFSCQKDDIITPTGPNLLDSLITLSTNIPNAGYNDLFFLNSSTGYAIAQNLIVKTTDGGINWTSTIPPINTPLQKIQFTDDQTGYIIGGDNTFGVLFKTTDGGQTWNTITLDTYQAPFGMYFINNSTGFITGQDLFIKTTNGGQSWTSLKDNVFRVYMYTNFKNATEGVITCSNGVYFKTVDGGISWDKMQSSSNDYLYDIYFADTKTLLTKSSDTLIDINHNDAVSRKPPDAHKLVFLNSQESIGIGSHYTNGYFPYGDLFFTNDGWNSYFQKTFSTSDALFFSAMAKMNEHKTMILGTGLAGTTVMVLNK